MIGGKRVIECAVENFVLWFLQFYKTTIKSSSVISSADGHLKHHEKETEVTMLELLKRTEGSCNTLSPFGLQLTSLANASKEHALFFFQSAIQWSGTVFLGKGLCPFFDNHLQFLLLPNLSGRKIPSPLELLNVVFPVGLMPSNQTDNREKRVCLFLSVQDPRTEDA